MRSTPDNVGFFRAVRTGDAAKVERYLAEGMSANTATKAGRPALHMATSPNVIRLLLKAGADLEARDREDERNALEAACDGPIEAVRAFIEANANVNAQHDHGYSTLMSAVGHERRSTAAIIRLLLESGADPRHVSDMSYNPIHAWVSRPNDAKPDTDRDDILKILLFEGVDIEARENRGEGPCSMRWSMNSTKTVPTTSAIFAPRFGFFANAASISKRPTKTA